MTIHRKIIISISLLISVVIVCLSYLNYKGHLALPAAKPDLLKDINIENNGYKRANISIRQSNLSVLIAETEEKRNLGLGHRSLLGTDQGMLFIFDHPDRYGFWMKDTLFPLDMIWIDKDKIIIDIENSVSPASYPKIFRPTAPALYVLEVNADYAKSHEIKTGMTVKF